MSEKSVWSKVSIVVAVRGNVSSLLELFQVIAAQNIDLRGIEVVIVDNHRRPRVVVRDLDWPFMIRVIHEPCPGLSRARNTGIRASTGDFILITDPDARPASQWVRQMVTALTQTGAYCVGGRVTGRFTSHSANVPAQVLQMFMPDKWPDRVVSLTSPYWLVGCNLGFRRNPLPHFNEWLGVRASRHLSCEDLEIVVRAQQAGRGVVVAPGGVVERALHRTDLRPAAILRRAFWHGVSVARLVALHPTVEIYDTYRFRDVLRVARLTEWLPTAAELARITGRRCETIRLARRAQHVRSGAAS